MNKELKLGIFQSIGITIYCGIVGMVMWKGNEIFGKQDTYIAPVAVLVMLSVSALICGLIVFYNPYILFFEGKKKEALKVVLTTAISLFVILLLLFGLMYFI